MSTTRMTLGIVLAGLSAGCSVALSGPAGETAPAARAGESPGAPPPAGGSEAAAPVERGVAKAVKGLQGFMGAATYRTQFFAVGTSLSWVTRFGGSESDVSGPIVLKENPEPEWILQWSGELDKSSTILVWAQARVNRTWLEDAKKAYGKHAEEVAAFDKAFRARLDEAKKLPGFYERVSALWKLREEAILHPIKNGFLGVADAVPGPAGEIQAAVFDEYRKAGVAWALDIPYRGVPHPFYKNLGPDKRTGEEQLQTFLDLAAAGYGGKHIDALPVFKPMGGGSKLADSVKWPSKAPLGGRLDFQPLESLPEDFALWADHVETPADIASAAYRRPEGHRDRESIPSFPQKVVTDKKSESVAEILSEPDPRQPKLVSVRARVVDIQPADGGTRVELVSVVTDADLSCVEHGPITGIDQSGKLTRNATCATAAERRTTRRFHVRFEHWPAGVAKGAVVAFYGDLEDLKVKGPLSKLEIDASMKGRFVSCFSGAGPTDPRKDEERFDMNRQTSEDDCVAGPW